MLSFRKGAGKLEEGEMGKKKKEIILKAFTSYSYNTVLLKCLAS